ncbi:MAG: hypothetical protein KBG15_22305 [Kofleriaceae bacterium]|nr:hypothetical protein [Kofleriaceae bacterium]
MNRLPQKFALTLGALVSTLMLTRHVASADIGPMDPARAICMGSAPGTPCTFEGKKGTCQGPHVSRMYCTPGAVLADPVKPSPDPATPPTPTPTPDPATPPTPANVEPAKPPTTPVLPTTPSKPPRKSGCAVSSAESLPAPLTFVAVVLGLGWSTRRRRASRIGA